MLFQTNAKNQINLCKLSSPKKEKEKEFPLIKTFGVGMAISTLKLHFQLGPALFSYMAKETWTNYNPYPIQSE